MILTQKHIVNSNHEFFEECSTITHLTKNLYNQALYRFRQCLFNEKTYMSFITLRDTFIRDQQVDYYALPTKVSQMCISKLMNNLESYYKTSKDYKKHPEKYKGKPNLPKYLDKEGHFSAEYYKEAISQKEFKKGFIKLSQTNIKVPFVNIEWKDLVGARITPKTNYFVIEVLYEVEENVVLEDNGRYLSIDLGLNNLAAITNNFGEKAVIINGRPIKSINQFFNKEKARIQSELKKVLLN